jgi:hypothetical protein
MSRTLQKNENRRASREFEILQSLGGAWFTVIYDDCLLISVL